MYFVCTLALWFFLPSPPLFASPAGSGPNDPISTLRAGKESLDSGMYEKALENLETAYRELPVLGDYTLFFMARAHNRIENFEESSRRVKELLSTYADSPLTRKARALEVDNILLTRDAARLDQKSAQSGIRASLSPQKTDEVIAYLDAYVSDYPDDAEMSFFFARLLKKLGKSDRAKGLFIKVYIGNNAFSELAQREMRPSDLTPQDMFARATNLMKAYEHKKAEALLRTTLPAAKEPLREEVQRALGQALFRQKRYTEASGIFLKAGDLYYAARSFYRAGDIAAFREVTSRLASMEDKRAGSLLLAYASKKRRDGRTDEAVDIYQDVRKRYPSMAEDAVWGIAWSFYRSGNFKKAGEFLAILVDRYPSSRYAYWKQRSAKEDRTGGSGGGAEETAVPDEGGITSPVPNERNIRRDYYHMLSHVRDMDSLNGRPLSKASWVRHRGTSEMDRGQGIEPGQLPPDILPLYDRFTLLMKLGMKDDAVGELVHLSNRITKPDLLVSLCRTLQGVGAYKRSISMLSRFSDQKGSGTGNDADVADILYPLAYWQTVSEISGHYSLDPFVLLAVMREESRFDPNARSIAGALGLMQIMPQTAFTLDKRLRMDISDPSEIYNVRVNITVGAYYLDSLLKEFGSLPVALAAYNAGHDKVREWVKEGRYRSRDEFIEDIPYDETRNYVKRVLLTYFTYLGIRDRQEKGS